MKIILIVLTIFSYALAEDGHDHAHEKKSALDVGQCGAGQTDCDKKDDHDEEYAHSEGEEDHGDDHGDDHKDDDHGEEENSAIGPDKGIIAKGPEGFKLSPEATKFFAYQTSEISGQTMTIPRAALVQVKDEKFVYRVRDGWIKRLGIKVLNKQRSSITVEFKEFSPKDSIIVTGTGFIRTTEIVVEEGVSHGHSH